MSGETGTRGGRPLRWTLAVGLGLAGVALNAFPVELLAGVHLLFGHLAVLAAAVLLGPAAGALAGAIAGAITPLLFGHPWVWVVFVTEGAAVGAARNRLRPLAATASFWLLAAIPYYLLLRQPYPAGTATTIVVKTVVESSIAALVVQAFVLLPRVHRALFAWLPAPLRAIRIGAAVRSVVLLAALLPLFVLAGVEGRLLYRQRVVELDRVNRATAAAVGMELAEGIAESREALEDVAHELEGSPARRRRALAGALFESPLLREAAIVEDGQLRLVVGLPREDGASLRSLPAVGGDGPERLVPVAGDRPPLLLLAEPVPGGGELIGSLGPARMARYLAVPDPRDTRVLLLDPAGAVLADTGGDPLDARFWETVDRATVAGTAAYLAEPVSSRTLRPRATTRVAVARIEPFELRVVVARQQGLILPALESEALALLASVFLALLVAVVAGLTLVRLIVEPVRAVSRAASGLEAGERTSRVNPRARAAPLELQRLAEGFDRMADELERQLRTTEAASRAKDEFLSVASHELKTPLTILKAQVQLLERRIEAGSRPELRLIDRQLDRITRLVSQLLDASAVGAGLITLEPREFELSETIRRVAQGLADAAPDHPLRLDLAPVTGRWDELRLEQVLHNLIGNAIKYSPAGAPIDVTLRARPEGGAELGVADRGMGIAPGQEARLFERFGRGTTTVGGFGVGLYVVREIVERHGGTVALTAREGGGTVARVRLPAEVPAGAPPTGSDRPA